MKSENKVNNLPPVIRVFLSSTFSDMQNERDYFNRVLLPKLSRICAVRGVSFFSVDLRWGITEEDQINGQVLPICLREIDKCRPYFIGIVGNRYGSVMETVPSQIADSIPWLVGQEGSSITELEMHYAVLDRERDNRVKNCAFYLRSDALSGQWYGEAQQDSRLCALKEKILSEDVPCRSYNDLETFGRLVEEDILRWLDQEFPVPERVNEVRREWYNRELLRGYIDSPKLQSFLDSYLTRSERPLLFYGAGGSGKTTFLTAWQPANGDKILINCGSDDVFLYWPSIARYIIDQIKDIDDTCGMPDFKLGASAMFRMMQNAGSSEQSGRFSTDFYLVTDQEREEFRVAFLQWLKTLRLEKPLYIVINDLNLLEDDSSRMLSWIPSAACGNIRFICSANDEEMVSNAENLGWNCTEMPGFSQESADAFIRNHLLVYGKSLSEAQIQTLLGAPAAGCPGQLRFITEFLVQNGRFENLGTLIGDLAARKQLQDVYRYVYDFSLQDLNARERKAVGTVFALLRFAQLSLSEPECFRLTKAHMEVSAIEWARIRSVFEEFGLVNGDYWNMREEGLQEFVDDLLPAEELSAIEELLGDDMLHQLYAVGDENGRLQQIRESTAFAKAALHHYQNCQNWRKLQEALTDDKVLFYLSKLDWQTVRVAWVTLFLHSETDIPGKLFALLERYQNAVGDARQRLLNVAHLFADLEYRWLLPRVCEYTKTDGLDSTLHGELNQVSKAFVPVYSALYELKEKRQFQQVFVQATEALETQRTVSPIERCQLLFFKVDAQLHLQQYRESLDTCNAYYAEAIRASSVYDLISALSTRGDVLFQLGQYDEAAMVQQQVGQMALRCGYLRFYLASQNILAMCLYHRKQYTESVAKFDLLIGYWRKLQDYREVASITMNKCNALALSGDLETALEVIKSEEPRLPAELQDLRVQLQGNAGYFAAELKRYDEAEAYLLQALAGAEALKMRATAKKVRSSLVRVYEQTDRFTEAVEQYNLLLEMLWESKEYSTLVSTLQRALTLLLTNKYGAMARQLRAHWEQRFDQIEGGSAFFHKRVRAEVNDSQHLSQLKEKLALAQSAGELAQIADICYELACAVKPFDPDQALQALLKAASCYRQCGREADNIKCLGEAMAGVFEQGVPKAHHAKVLEQLADPAMQRIAVLWEQLGASKKESRAPEKTSTWDHVTKKNAEENPSVPALLEELLAYSQSYEQVVLLCLTDVVRQVIDGCSTQQILQIVQSLPETAKKAFAGILEAKLLETFQLDFEALTRDYTSYTANEKLAYYEKCLEVLEELQSTNAAAVAGNLAIIYRRREDEDRTIRYHTISTRAYKKRGAVQDYLIELMNTASAYSKFGRQDQAASVLRTGIKEAAEAGASRLEACMAGNLAAILARSVDPKAREEAMRCFAIEEKFFRNLGAPRDLVISLLNQILYLQKLPDNREWLEKLREAGTLIRANGFREYEKTLAQLEWKAKSFQSAAGEMPEDAAEANVRQLLAAENIYCIDEISKEDGAYHVICNPKQPSQTEHERLHLLLDPKDPNRVSAIFLCQPKLVAVESAAAVQEYIDWWNGLDEYRLALHEEKMVLQASCGIWAADWDGVIQQFAKIQKLWEADKFCLSSMCVGITDMPMFQSTKLRILNNDT